jgi:hypothetical protein
VESISEHEDEDSDSIPCTPPCAQPDRSLRNATPPGAPKRKQRTPIGGNKEILKCRRIVKRQALEQAKKQIK